MANDVPKDDHLQQQANVWDRFAEGYSKQPIADQEAYNKKLEMTRKYFHKDSTYVVEFGCGTGGTSILHAPFVKHILATDLSPKMIDIAKVRAAETGVTNVEFQVASVDQMDIPQSSQDVVLGLSVLHLLPDCESTIRKVHSWLKPGGYFVTSTVCAGDMSWSRQAFYGAVVPLGKYLGFLPDVHALTKSGLKESFVRAGFSIEQEWQPKKGDAVFLVGRKKDFFET